MVSLMRYRLRYAITICRGHIKRVYYKQKWCLFCLKELVPIFNAPPPPLTEKAGSAPAHWMSIWRQKRRPVTK